MISFSLLFVKRLTYFNLEHPTLFSSKNSRGSHVCACLQLPGLISLSTKLLPTVMNLLKKLAEEGQIPTPNNNDPPRNPVAASKNYANGVSTSEMSSSASSEVTSSGNGTKYSSATKEE